MAKEKGYNIPNSLNFLHHIFGEHSKDFQNYLSILLTYDEPKLPAIIVTGPRESGKTVFVDWLQALLKSKAASVWWGEDEYIPNLLEKSLLMYEGVPMNDRKTIALVNRFVTAEMSAFNAQGKDLQIYIGTFIFTSQVAPVEPIRRAWHVKLTSPENTNHRLLDELKKELPDFKEYLINKELRNTWNRPYFFETKS